MGNIDQTDIKNLSIDNKGSKRQIWMSLLKVVISAGILWFLISRIDLNEVYDLMRTVSIQAFILAFLVNLIIHLCFILRWKVVLQELHPGTKILRMISFHFIGLFFNLFIPTSIGGDVIKGYYTSKDTGKTGASFLSVFLDRYIGLLAIVAIAAIAACAGRLSINGAPVYPWVLGIFVIAILITLLLSTNFAQYLNKLLGKRLKFVQNIISLINESSKATLKSRKVMIWTFLLTLGVVILTVVVNYILIGSIGKSIDIKDLFMFIPLIILIASIPISISGLGPREGAYMYLFASIGFTNSESLSLSLLNFLLLLITSLPGVLVYILLRRKGENILKTEKDLTNGK
jgi:uncharacterized protein (TIRG00374 family)